MPAGGAPRPAVRSPLQPLAGSRRAGRSRASSTGSSSRTSGLPAAAASRRCLVGRRRPARSASLSSFRASSVPSGSSSTRGNGSKRRGQAGTRRDQERELLADQPPRCERERVGGRPVEPVRVVEDDQRRRLVGELHEQRQRPCADRQGVGLALLERERRAERVRLRAGQARKQVEHGPEQLVQAREGKLRARTRRRSPPGRRMSRPDGSPRRAAPSCPGRRRRPATSVALRPRRASSSSAVMRRSSPSRPTSTPDRTPASD